MKPCPVLWLSISEVLGGSSNGFRDTGLGTYGQQNGPIFLAPTQRSLNQGLSLGSMCVGVG